MTKNDLLDIQCQTISDEQQDVDRQKLKSVCINYGQPAEDLERPML